MENKIKNSLELIGKDEFLSLVKFNDMGLVPVIAQQHDTGDVLMMAWANKEALIETIETKRMCYYSRSRKEFWRKGDTSGHIQKMIDLYIDCDGDTILAKIDQVGAACHTNNRSCFYRKLDK
ncbi:MAG: phosphoribosyl-AMP cyclohydrolase [Alphaproteobacteria bacterium]|nr:phosphoribosyl-AMP cyclohydrolase [Alphaproteobacteria bacterium]